MPIYRNNYAKLLALILLLSMNYISDARSEKIHYTYQTVSISQNLTQSLYFQGTVTPFNTYTVIAPFDAIITKPLGFYYGQLLTKGQYLFTVKPSGDSDNYRDALIAYLNAKRSYNTSLQKFSGQQLMYNNGLIAKNDFIDAQTQILDEKITLEQSLLHLQTVIKLITADANSEKNLLNSLENLNLDDKNIQAALAHGFNEVPLTSPAAGIALTPPSTDSNQSNAPIGINTTVKSGQALVVIGNLTGIKININVEETSINKLIKGQAVTITGPAFSQFTLKGSVDSISYQESANQYGSGNPTYPATVVVPELTVEQQKVIHSGMTANIAILLPQPDAILVPITAIIIDGNNSFVLKKVAGNLVKTPVMTGRTTLDRITILSGLKNGDIIAIPN